MIVGGIVSWNALNDPRGGFGLFVFTWVVIAVINIAYARRR
jgi:cbb3-type cytochrome oxidase subunit 3